ncbi:MAG TPA: response regulator [Candidatus Limnocylindria bacterium]|jgi:DNA-binding response OmpR family regulator|nr:response regulator [Candidatus Limnocylindria bacterium]
MERIRVLVIEDDDDTRRLIEQELDEAGYEVVPALDGRHALRLAKTAKPAVLLVDIGLPVMNGDEFVRRWRSSPQAGDAAIVIVSGRKDARDVAKALGVETVIPKPFRIEHLVATVGRFAHPAGGTATSVSPA